MEKLSKNEEEDEDYGADKLTPSEERGNESAGALKNDEKIMLRGVYFGLLLGILGNLLVSSLNGIGMNRFSGGVLEMWYWVSLVLSGIATVYLIRLLDRLSR